jgi:uncharacterized membrane protein YebE (DUF533 family)
LMSQRLFSFGDDDVMFDATTLLGGLLEGRPTASMPGRLGAAVQQGAQGGLLQQLMSQFGGAAPGGGLGALLGSVMSGPAANQGGASGVGGIFDEIAAMGRRAATSPREELAANNPAAVGGLGALAGAILGGGRGAIGGGLMAVLGSLAYTAYQNASAAPSSATGAVSNSSAIGSLAEVPGYSDPAEIQRKARLTIRAMIQACKADGHIDAVEAQRLVNHIDDTGDAQEARAFIQAEMQRPVDIADLARSAKSREEAAEIYAASIMAIDIDTPVEREYLAALAKALTLPPSVIEQIHTSLNVKA